MNNIILLIIILIIYIFVYNITEYFKNIPVQPNINNYINNNQIDTTKINTYNMPYQPPKLERTINLIPQINGKEAVISHNNYSLLNDPLFKDVIYYENNVETEKLGLDTCIEECNGNCVEYGQTGNSYCFPAK